MSEPKEPREWWTDGEYIHNPKDLTPDELEHPDSFYVVEREAYDQLKQELETERMRLAACGVVAMSNTDESAKKAREMLPEYFCASVKDVARAVDREMSLRSELSKLRTVAEKMAAQLKTFVVHNTIDRRSCEPNCAPCSVVAEYEKLKERG